MNQLLLDYGYIPAYVILGVIAVYWLSIPRFLGICARTKYLMTKIQKGQPLTESDLQKRVNNIAGLEFAFGSLPDEHNYPTYFKEPLFSTHIARLKKLKRTYWKLLILVGILVVVLFCGRVYVVHLKGQEPSAKSELFDEEIITALYAELDAEFYIGFKQSHLEILLRNRDMMSLRAGEVFEEELLFEDFECDCLDKMRVSYAKADKRFVLWIYEEIYEADLDWCPESTYSYSFQIENHKVTDLKLDFMAG